MEVIMGKIDDKLFTMSQAVTATGLSRSTLLRMEEKGLFTPAYVSPDSGRRYYDNWDIARIVQIHKFQQMGFTSEQINSYFSSGFRSPEHLHILEQKMIHLQRSLEEIQVCSMLIPNLTVAIIKMPGVYCCTRRFGECDFPISQFNAMYDFYHDCIASGHTIGHQPLFIINERTDYLEGRLEPHMNGFSVCIPINDTDSEDAVYFPACHAISVLYYGDYNGITEAWLKLGEEVKARGLTPAGLPRTIGIVAPYTGREIDPKHYCSRLALPIETEPSET